MKTYDAVAGVLDDATTPNPMKKCLGRDPNWNIVNKIRTTPELAKRFRKNSAVSSVGNPISQVTESDESSRTFEADLDEAGGLNYKASQKHFSNPPLHVYAPGGKDGERGKHAARLTSTYRHDKSKKVRMSVKVHDEDEWGKISEGMYSHVRIETKPGASGGQVPVKFTLSDSSAAEPAKYLKLAKADGSVESVDFKRQDSVGAGPLLKCDGAYDPFRNMPLRRGF